MMKKICNYSIRLILIVSLLSVYVLEPMSVNAASSATTLAGLRKELTDLQNKKKQNENKKKLTQSEINQKNVDISNAKKEIQNSESKIILAKEEIELTKTKITEMEKQIEDLMKYFQIMSGDNSYLEFLTDSSSMTELIMRTDAVNQLTVYNKEKLKEASDLIKENEQKQVDLKNYEKQLERNITEYEKKISELDSSLLQLSDVSVSIDDEISLQQAAIKMYEQMGCGETENLEVCVARTASSGWLKPVTKGRISSVFGYRNLPGQSSNHSGIDVAVAENTTVYSATNGTVIKTLNRTSCGGNQVYVQSYVNGEPYTILYAHLLSVNVSAGQKITNQTIIGYSGGYSTSTAHGGYDTCTTGAHLHFSVSKCVYKSYSNYVANLINPPGFPKKGGWFYSRTQWFE
ncbi:MAG: peptidoglycan DD-metalloendopeptidase family protein [Bacilli bacterium]|nr:peptidoglycan DD-metalloendopeptidase family protein [Bacilli bacterium]